jgi:hypothetical protein
MGFNFTGIAINKNYQDKIEEVSQIFDMKLTLKEEIYFENAMSSHKPDDTCDIYFFENCTIVFLSEPIQLNLNKLSINRQIASFMASETAMVFELEVSENQQTIRYMTEFNNDRMEDEGDKFEDEDEDDGMEVVFKGIANTINKSFWGIEPDEKAYRYSISQ